jgi:hypothetical protein
VPLDYLPKIHSSPAINGGSVELHPLANGTRLDVMGKDPKGRPVRLETRHYTNVQEARVVAAWCAVTLCIPYKDHTGEATA